MNNDNFLKEFLKNILEPFHGIINWVIGILIAVTIFVYPIAKWVKKKNK